MTIPEGPGEAEPLLVVANSGKAVFAPAISSRTRLLMRQIVPGITVRTIILAHRSPLAVAKVWSPQVPALFLRIIFFDTRLIGLHDGLLSTTFGQKQIRHGIVVAARQIAISHSALCPWPKDNGDVLRRILNWYREMLRVGHNPTWLMRYNLDFGATFYLNRRVPAGERVNLLTGVRANAQNGAIAFTTTQWSVVLNAQGES